MLIIKNIALVRLHFTGRAWFYLNGILLINLEIGWIRWHFDVNFKNKAGFVLLWWATRMSFMHGF